ncbi:hypothetical protein TTHNP4_00010 (plasmid) [Thermus thermophilus]|jgi:hypothetical protein|uniref:Anti-sigma K factor RskA C-terminal domain-containing protein n=2 Tax=Thermus TaxID=270 RepID=A0A3P4AX75_THETH|nr:hypothetical protein TTHNP4_00010 [Thermus thermophilus]
MIHPDPDSLIALALDTLPEAQRKNLMAHIRRCSSCRETYRRHLEALAHLAQSQEPLPVPVEWEQELKERLRTSAPASLPSRFRAQRRAFLLVLGGALLGLVALWAYPKYQDILAWRRFMALSSQPGARLMPLVDPAGYQTGWALRTADGGVVLYLKKPPPPGRVYQAWWIQGEGRKSLGTTPGRMLEVGVPLPEGSWLGVSVEPPGGSPSPTTPSVGRAQL